ncbi:hypothetical protein DFJ73DRAFT_774641 [Zopfochytrium polystomum]|nr:hypothetical protein DFJ73DRAFT_774641 [Zopfochytrium polystomum]
MFLAVVAKQVPRAFQHDARLLAAINQTKVKEWFTACEGLNVYALVISMVIVIMSPQQTIASYLTVTTSYTGADQVNPAASASSSGRDYLCDVTHRADGVCCGSRDEYALQYVTYLIAATDDNVSIRGRDVEKLASQQQQRVGTLLLEALVPLFGAWSRGTTASQFGLGSLCNMSDGWRHTQREFRADVDSDAEWPFSAPSALDVFLTSAAPTAPPAHAAPCLDTLPSSVTRLILALHPPAGIADAA